MVTLSIHKQIEARIKKRKRGKIFFPADFVDLGDTEVIKKTLLRLEQQGLLTRLAFGIYLYPKKSELLGNLTPSIEEIAMAIAHRDRARIIPTGVYTLNALGLSTQVPLNAVYLTDGASRKIKVGKRAILFKKTSPRNLSVKGPISGLAIQALKAIGEGKVDKQEEKKLMEILQRESRENIVHDLSVAPEWIRKIIRKAISENA